MPLWQTVEQHMICAMLYHCDSIEDLYKLNKIPKDRLRDYINEEKLIKLGCDCDTAEEEEARKSLLAEFRTPDRTQLLDEFSLIGIKLNKILDWMIAKLNGSKEFGYEITEIGDIA